MKIQLGDVVEIIGNVQKWAIGCLAVVDGLYPWGISGYIPKPFLAHAAPTRVYIRADYDQIHLVARCATTIFATCPIMNPNHFTGLALTVLIRVM